MIDAKDEMFEGYRDGLNDTRDELPDNHNRSAAYQHGWRNGRDDRMHRPRAPAETLRKEAEKAIAAFVRGE